MKSILALCKTLESHWKVTSVESISSDQLSLMAQSGQVVCNDCNGIQRYIQVLADSKLTNSSVSLHKMPLHVLSNLETGQWVNMADLNVVTLTEYDGNGVATGRVMRKLLEK